MSSKAHYIGVDLGRSTRIAIVDNDGKIVSYDRVPTRLANGRALVDGLIELIKKFKSEAVAQIAAVGIGLPGLIDYSSQAVKILPNLPDVSTIDMTREMVTAIGLPILFDNDANAAAYGEWQCGAAQNARDFAYITMGTGIGGALVMGGQLQRGARGFAGEFGHVKIGTNDLACSCGSAGCLETVASGPNIVRRARERLFTDPRFTLSPLMEKMRGKIICEDVVDAALANDELARSVLSETARYLGTAIANVVNMLNVEKVVLGGPVMAAGEFLLKAIRAEASYRCFVPLFTDCAIVVGELGADAGMIGAAMMARDFALVKRI